jgi:multisubunit Na+/H+ antiporter MnhF subunit
MTFADINLLEGFALLLLGCALMLGLFRLILGPAAPDRLVAAGAHRVATAVDELGSCIRSVMSE